MRKILDVVIGALIGLAAAGAIWLTASPPRGQAVTLRPPPTPVPIVVQVSGSVPRPGVYELPAGSRVRDAVDAAGGFLAGADYGSVNLALPLNDGQEVVIAGPTPEGDDAGSDTTRSGDASDVVAPNPLVDINTATAEELETLPGIGPTLAQRIVDYRTQNGPFETIEDIMNVSGIGLATFENFRMLIYASD